MTIDELIAKYDGKLVEVQRIIAESEPPRSREDDAIEQWGEDKESDYVEFIADLKALKAESKPSWDDAPEWANSMRQGRGKPWEWHGFLKYRPVDELPTAAEVE